MEPKIKENYVNISTHKCNGIYFYNDMNNCKLSILSGIETYFGGGQSIKEYKENFDHILKQCNIIISLNTRVKKLKDWILNNYQIYFCEEVPIGYDSNPIQYHIIIKNPFKKDNKYLRDKETVEVIEKSKVMEVFTKANKKRLRKDIVETFIEELK